jgi:purine/pyrimidine-nucleoside phosphorylase|tara:strand:+ start:11899 stop:12213 length:315 start_codon:yes stop_codon:yes gene_type:complete
MSEFNNVTIVKKANVYFNGQVVSRTVMFDDGSSKTLGYMMPGEYSFDTQAAEVMEILAGKFDVLLPGASQWQSVSAGESFNVPANSTFQLKIHEATDYCCSYLS